METTAQKYRFQNVAEVADHLARVFVENGLEPGDVGVAVTRPFVRAIVLRGQLRTHTEPASQLWVKDVRRAMVELIG